MANGLRLWCVDRDDGSIIHLGGEYTWGDCAVVGEILDDLATKGILPGDGDYGGGTVAQIAVVTDGAGWIVDRLVDRFPGAVWILDIYHLLERLASHAAVLYGKGTKNAKAWYEAAARAVSGEPAKKQLKCRRRRGH